MYKLQHSGMSRKLFLMEGDEDKTKNLFAGAKSNMEKERRLKRVKTLRLVRSSILRMLRDESNACTSNILIRNEF